MLSREQLREIAVVATERELASEPENPEWDSLDRLSILATLHTKFEGQLGDAEGLDEFEDFETLYSIFKKLNLVF